jgi:DNA-binding SARP family transcriptional activator
MSCLPTPGRSRGDDDVAQDQLFRIDLLGRFRVSVGGEPAREPVSSRGSELLALLVLEDGQRVSRELIASRLWPESGEAQARTNLRRELHQLRRVLPQSEKGIEAHGQYLALRIGEVGSDVHDLRGALGRAEAARKEARKPDEIAALAEAARIYAGELFPECFSEWLGPPRERWKEEVAAALRRLIALLEERRDLLEGIRWARRLTEIDALDEVAYRTLMRLRLRRLSRRRADGKPRRTLMPRPVAQFAARPVVGPTSAKRRGCASTKFVLLERASSYLLKRITSPPRSK